VIVDANPIPVVSIRPGESLRYKNKALYVNPNDRIVMYGSCVLSAGSVSSMQWTISDMLGNAMDMGDGTWLPLGSAGEDFVLLGGSELLSGGESVRALLHACVVYVMDWLWTWNAVFGLSVTFNFPLL
jgi:hypothetical protein